MLLCCTMMTGRWRTENDGEQKQREERMARNSANSLCVKLLLQWGTAVDPSRCWRTENAGYGSIELMSSGHHDRVRSSTCSMEVEVTGRQFLHSQIMVA